VIGTDRTKFDDKFFSSQTQQNPATYQHNLHVWAIEGAKETRQVGTVCFNIRGGSRQKLWQGCSCFILPCIHNRTVPHVAQTALLTSALSWSWPASKNHTGTRHWNLCGSPYTTRARMVKGWPKQLLYKLSNSNLGRKPGCLKMVLPNTRQVEHELIKTEIIISLL
jgi:hypothetical protein